MMVIWNSFLYVVLAEMGDKTQLLTLMLMAYYRKPWSILSGIFVATILNHFMAAYFGGRIQQGVDPNVLKFILVASFLIFGCWILIPDKAPEDENMMGLHKKHGWGPFVTTTIAFFVAEMGDKTQLATAVLGVKYGDPFGVTIGTTFGMLVADGVALLSGGALLKKIPMAKIRILTSALFFLSAFVVYFDLF